jgi:hypothetical protein
MSLVDQAGTDAIRLNWKDDINAEPALPLIDYVALIQYAKDINRRHMKHASNIECQLSDKYNMGGLHVVRLLDFEDGTTWLARLQLHQGTAESCQRLITEIHTIQVVRERSKVRVPEVFGYDASDDNPVGVPFMLLEYIPAMSAMDSFGGGQIPQHLRADYQASMANIHVRMNPSRLYHINQSRLR